MRWKRRIGRAMVCAATLAGCDSADNSGSVGATAMDASGASVRASAPIAPPAQSPLPAPPSAKAIDPNPLRLPPRRLKLDAGRRVFTFSDRMLAGAKLGSTLVLYPATVAGFDGDDLVIEGREGPPYKVHAGYVIPVPDEPRVRAGDAVLTEWNLVAKHAVVKKIAKDKIHVRYTDMDSKTPEGVLPYLEKFAPGGRSSRVIKLADGLAPGNYAALEAGGEWQHVLLVSPAVDGEQKRWFALGYGGAALLAEEANLRAIPVRFKPKNGAEVRAEWVGTMRKATVQAADDPGFFTVAFERAGRPATVGWGFIMPPP